MKKALIYGLSAALLLASLTACNKPQADQQDTEPNPTQAATSIPAPEEPTTTPEPEVTQDPTTQTPAAPEQLSNEVPAPPDETDTSQPPEGTDPQEPAPEPEIVLFDDVDEIVYATGNVNIRESWTASSTKLGSLSRGQSVTRTGTSIKGTEAEGWSRVQLSDGTIAYISNQYLSTTKPSQQSTNNGGGGSTTTPGTQTGGTGTGTGDLQDTGAPTGGYSSNPNGGFKELTPGQTSSEANEVGEGAYSGWIN